MLPSLGQIAPVIAHLSKHSKTTSKPVALVAAVQGSLKRDPDIVAELVKGLASFWIFVSVMHSMSFDFFIHLLALFRSPTDTLKPWAQSTINLSCLSSPSLFSMESLLIRADFH